MREELQQQEVEQAEMAESGGQGSVGHTGESGEPSAESEHQLELIEGLGPTFRERLNEAGIRTIDELAGTDPDTVAEAADVSHERAEEWIEQATE